MTKVHPKGSIPTLKPSLSQEPTSSRTRHTMLILQQNRNTNMNIKRQVAQSHAKPMDTPKLTTGQFTALQREEIQLHPPEHGHKLPYQEKLTSHSSNPTHREQPPQRGTTNFKHTERAPQTQKPKQNEKAEKYSAGKGT